MFATKVSGDGNDVGGTLEAFSDLGPVGFLDTMRITRWEPPRRCDVEHTGRVVRGTGSFQVEARGEHATLIWIEDLDIPGGPLGRAAFALARPAFMSLIDHSLRRFARLVERRDRDMRD